LFSPKIIAENPHFLAEPQVLCSVTHCVLQPPMNVRLVKLDLVLLLPEANLASYNATNEAGEKYENGIQHSVHPEKHSQPVPAEGEDFKPMGPGHSPKRLATLRGTSTAQAVGF